MRLRARAFHPPLGKTGAFKPVLGNQAEIEVKLL